MPKTIAIVVPIYNEITCLPKLLEAYCDLMAACPQYQWRVIFVDDGSQDGSLAYLQTQADRLTPVVCVELSRNFGHQVAVAAGLAHAQDADAVIIMDGDMQDPPSLIADMLAAYESGAEVVLAHRSDRAERGWRRWGMALFHRYLIRLCDFPLQPDVGVFSLLAKPVVAQLNQMKEANRYLPAMRAWLGFRVRTVTYVRDARYAGQPKQRLRHLIKEASNCIFSFSHLPIRLISYLGGLTCLMGFALMTFFVCKRIFFHDPAVTGFTTLLSVMVFFGGVQLLCLGVVGHYVARIHEQSLQRPLFVVRAVHAGAMASQQLDVCYD